MAQDASIRVYVGDVDNIIEKYGCDVASLPTHRKESYARCKNEDDKRRSLAVSHLYVQALKEQGLDVDMGVHFAKNGKLCLDCDDNYVNLSHGGDYVACAIAGCEIGVDVESIRPCKDTVLRRMLKSENLDDTDMPQHILGLSGKEKDRAFTSYWTRKESQVKLDGRGIGALGHLDESLICTKTFEPFDDCFLSVSVYADAANQTMELILIR